MRGCLTFIFKATGVFIGLIIALVFIVMNIHVDDDTPYDDYSSRTCREFDIQKYDSINGYYKDVKRSWLDLSYKDFCYNYNLLFSHREKSNSKYKEFKSSVQWSPSNDVLFYGEVYDSLYKQNIEYLKPITDSLSNIAFSEGLNRKQTAEMIVSFIQDIPYSYVFSTQDCATRENKRHPCVTGHKYGIITPTNFLYSLSGDCDTRALLLYLFLKQLDYDVSIVISQEYLHAMIAINLPYEGDYIEHNQKKYYFWETTATGWSPGVLPPTCNNINYWDIALI